MPLGILGVGGGGESEYYVDPCAYMPSKKKKLIPRRTIRPVRRGLVCIRLRLFCFQLFVVCICPGGCRNPRVFSNRRILARLTLAPTPPTAATATATPSTTTPPPVPLLFVSPYIFWLPILFSSVPFACTNLVHFPACALLSRIVDALLYLTYSSLHRPFVFFAFLESFFVSFHILWDQLRQSSPGSERAPQTNRRCLIFSLFSRILAMRATSSSSLGFSCKWVVDFFGYMYGNDFYPRI